LFQKRTADRDQPRTDDSTAYSHRGSLQPVVPELSTRLVVDRFYDLRPRVLAGPRSRQDWPGVCTPQAEHADRWLATGDPLKTDETYRKMSFVRGPWFPRGYDFEYKPVRIRPVL
jgi:hypothetical protein